MNAPYEVISPSFLDMNLEAQIAAGVNEWCVEGEDGHPFYGRTKAEAAAVARSYGVQVPPSFPIGTIRAAVAAKGDAWTHHIAPKPMNSNHRICECEDYWVMAWCAVEIQTKGRAASMQRRAFSAVDDNEDDLIEVAA